MSRKHKHRHDYKYSNGFPNFYMFLILILIVLQWFRVGSTTEAGSQPESNLVSNGGLFIITLFFLAACSCYSMQEYPGFRKHHSYF
jgi:hypothetical protein